MEANGFSLLIRTGNGPSYGPARRRALNINGPFVRLECHSFSELPISLTQPSIPNTITRSEPNGYFPDNISFGR